ncbi:DUTPase [Weissella viridescens]|uniref:Dutpase n=2 Tax=Weissella viridescens TaxID=1629 RepID=A0A0R2H2B5_WEIVI|nr:hypothetical protein [Weissella viridescens]KRN46558.1 dutpase [Weissella viridescens]MBX4172910.1 dUTPase [Weissella viridescens]GEA94402.1 hypothetical protein WVI01_03250 [Weissella viridescens]SOB42505.1 DUTPase [Weissella viridescens]
MLLDFASYLHDTKSMFGEVSGNWERPIKRDDMLLNDYLNLDISLSNLMAATHTTNANVPDPVPGVPDTEAVDLYAQALVQFLCVSLKQDWTHLIVLEDEDLDAFKRFPQRYLLHQFAGIKTMLSNSYHQKRQDDFSHAWRSFLKLGLNELALEPVAIDAAVRKIVTPEN